MTGRTAEIKLTVELDAESLPKRIEWEASEARHAGPRSAQSMMLSLWDGEAKTAAAIDLWTADITVADMNRHFFEVFHKMAETYLRATNDAEVAGMIHEFGDTFATSVDLRSRRRGKGGEPAGVAARSTVSGPQRSAD